MALHTNVFDFALSNYGKFACTLTPGMSRT